ncbi:hypothetical protein [Rhodanobacter sp. DHB23]|nr:hypothetical protein [Rhodanobacter sp. DHB23]
MNANRSRADAMGSMRPVQWHEVSTDLFATGTSMAPRSNFFGWLK